MINAGTAVFYIILSLVTRLIRLIPHFLPIKATKATLNISNTLLVAGIVLLLGAVSTLFPSVPDIVSRYVLVVVTLGFALQMLLIIRGISSGIKYDVFFYERAIRQKNKQLFEEAYRKSPDTLFKEDSVLDLIEYLAKHGLLESWLEKKKKKFTYTQLERYESQKLLDLMNKDY